MKRPPITEAVSDPFLRLDFFAREFGVSRDHLQNISLAQRGRLKRKDGTCPFSTGQLSRYPTFIKGPGGLGLYASQYAEWRETANVPLPRIA